MSVPIIAGMLFTFGCGVFDSGTVGAGYDPTAVIINDIVVKIGDDLTVTMKNRYSSEVRVRLVIRNPNGVVISEPYYYKTLAANGGTATFTWECNVSEADAGLNYRAYMQKNDGTDLFWAYFHVARPMKVEYDYMEGLDVWNDHLDDDSRKEVKDIFEEVALAIEMNVNDAELPPYEDVHGNIGPFPEDAEELLTYAQNHYNTTLSWHLLAVDNYVNNTSTSLNTRGLTSFYSINQAIQWNEIVPSSWDRYSFIFLQDMITVANNNGWTAESLLDVIWETTAHELGHQRAGLSHPYGMGETHPEYHNAEMNLDQDSEIEAVCIMWPLGLSYSEGSYYRFCSPNYPDHNAYDMHNTTCLGNFVSNLGAN